MNRVGIVGFRGYSGQELVRLLTAHPHVEPVLLEHRSEGEAAPLPRRAPRLATAPATAEGARDAGLFAVMLATPHEVALDLTPGLLDAGIRVIDLSAAFRLRTNDVHERWYGHAHPRPDLLASAAYGLPEFYRDRVKGAQLVANPGCYPTAANLALRPLLAAGAIERERGIVCDAKSGVSGAGRKPSLKTHFCEAADNFSAYALLEHRHVPEVLQNSGVDEADFSFSAQLIPIERGILETIYFRTGKTAAELLDIYEQAYAHEPFVRLFDAPHVPDLHGVRHTNYCDLGVRVDERTGRAVVVAAIDNLIKGAAGQAVQNLNLLLGCPETAGLL